jgi:two-component system, OmpR family, sensor histidine kinase KdpD
LVLVALAMVAASTWLAFYLGLGMATAGFLYLFLVVLAAVYGGFWLATATSVAAVACLDYFFVQPLFTFNVDSPEDWVGLGAFEFTALVVSRLSYVAKLRASEAIAERRDSERLYQTSRRILLFDRSSDPGGLLTALICEVFELEAVLLFDATLARNYSAGNSTSGAEERIRNAFSGDASEYDPNTRTWYCVLRLDARPVGGLALCGCTISPLVASAVASLCAIALERARSLEREYRAEAARQSEQLRAAVLDALGHEFKTPVATIWAASSGLLAAGGLSNLQSELLTLIDEQSNRLNDLATRLLTTAKLDSASLQPQRQPLLLSKVVNSVIRGLDARHDGGRFRVSAPPAEATVLADSRLIAAAVTQLIDNALKYSVPESPIEVRLASKEGEAIVSVRNQGPVIEPADRERIFERFYRAAGTENGPAGTGLGLSIVKRIADAHHGRVWVESEAAKGTAFFLALPMAPKTTKIPAIVA